jgi:hypothetical protein
MDMAIGGLMKENALTSTIIVAHLTLASQRWFKVDMA